MSQTGSTTRTVGSLGSSTDSGNGGGGSNFPSHKKVQRNKQRKILRILTVVAYMMSVSTIALVLSAYYLFIWKPTPTEPLNYNRGTTTDYPTTSHHYYNRQTSSVLQAHDGTNRVTGLEPQTNNKGNFLPTPQGLAQDDESDDHKTPPSPLYPDANDPDSKSTSTPQRAPASAPELPVSRTTPNILKIIAPTKSPT